MTAKKKRLKRLSPDAAACLHRARSIAAVCARLSKQPVTNGFLELLAQHIVTTLPQRLALCCLYLLLCHPDRAVWRG
jgi:hypothetical protein